LSKAKSRWSDGFQQKVEDRFKEQTIAMLPSRVSRAAVSSSSSSKAAATATTSTPKSRPKGRPPSKRTLPLRKDYLVAQYTHILTQNKVVVFLRPGDFSVAELTRLRVELAGLAASSDRSSSSSSSVIPSPIFTFLRPGLVPPVFKTIPHMPSQAVLAHLKQHKGNLCLLTLPSLDPPMLKAALKAVKKLSDTPNPRKLAAASGAGGAAGKKPAQTAAKAAAEQRLTVVSAIVEGKEVAPVELGNLANLPSLQDILGQLVGLLETPARQILGLSQQAAGGDLARALEGFRIGLQETAGAASSETKEAGSSS
jgi:ribosomal protein L10